MNLKTTPDSSTAASTSSDEDDERTKMPRDDQRIVNWTKNINLFILCFLAGVFTASVIALVASEYFDGMRNKSNSASSKSFLHDNAAAGGLLPDPDHIRVVDETKYFSTQIERFTIHSNDNEDIDTTCSEAKNNLRAALIFQKNKNVEKASKLFKHALALCPKHPKVLNAYGEFLIDLNEDPIEADHMFEKAKLYSASGSTEREKALTNRRRTALVVEELDSRMLKSIDIKKKSFAKISPDSSALKRAKKEAYFQHIYHTVGIEGNTLNLGQTRHLLETKLAIGGKSVQEHNEVLGLDAALKYINMTLVDRVPGHITMQDILEIHKRVIGYVDPVEAGLFRQTQVFVGDFIPPHSSHIDLLMRRFLDWLNDPENMLLHPVRFAALAHYKLVYIHPFTDGNGRTSRLLMNWILMQNGFPPVIIRKQDRLSYYQHLVTANDGDIRPFVRFIAKCTARTLEAYIWSTKDNSLAPFGDESETIRSPKEAMDHLSYHDAIISGGSLGPNITVEAP